MNHHTNESDGVPIVLCETCEDEWPEDAVSDGECPECRDYGYYGNMAGR